MEEKKEGAEEREEETERRRKAERETEEQAEVRRRRRAAEARAKAEAEGEARARAAEETLTPLGAAADRAALMELFQECGGGKWRKSANWGTDRPLGEWYGVTVAGDRVVELLSETLVGDAPCGKKMSGK